MSDQVDLIPVDIEQCQTEVKKYNPFVMGGPCHTVAQCEAKPAFVVTETEPDTHGQIGAMSLCAEHLLRFQENMPNHDTAYIKQTVEDWQAGQDAGLVKSVYGFCPICGAKGISRERRPNGDDRCENNHTYPSKISKVS